VATTIELPGGIRLRAAGQHEQADLSRPDWGVYADHCWDGWPGLVLEWPDFGVPDDDDAALTAIVEAIRRAEAGEDVLVGCRGGIGRTGTIVAAAAVARGVPADEAREWVRQRLHPFAVETDEQARWITGRVAGDRRFAARID
jgi:hypothetical protein